MKRRLSVHFGMASVALLLLGVEHLLLLVILRRHIALFAVVPLLAVLGRHIPKPVRPLLLIAGMLHWVEPHLRRAFRTAYSPGTDPLSTNFIPTPQVLWALASFGTSTTSRKVQNIEEGASHAVYSLVKFLPFNLLGFDVGAAATDRRRSQ